MATNNYKQARADMCSRLKQETKMKPVYDNTSIKVSNLDIIDGQQNY